MDIFELLQAWVDLGSAVQSQALDLWNQKATVDECNPNAIRYIKDFLSDWIPRLEGDNSEDFASLLAQIESEEG